MNTSPYPAFTPSPQAAETKGGVGLAIASLVIGILGLCVPLVGLIGVVLGVVVLATKRAGKGLAIGGIATGASGVFVSLVMLGLLLPALAAARDAARSAKSGIQMEAIALVMAADAANANGAFPGKNVDLEARYAQSLTPQMWDSPFQNNQAASTGYLYLLVPAGADPSKTPMLIEQPEFSGREVNVAYADGSLSKVRRTDAEVIIRNALPNVYTTDGKQWKPSRTKSP